MVPQAEFCYNNTVQSSIKKITFNANYSYHPVHTYPTIEVISTISAVEELILTLQKVKEDISDTIILAQIQMAKYCNQRVSTNELIFNLSDWVTLNTKNIKTI